LSLEEAQHLIFEYFANTLTFRTSDLTFDLLVCFGHLCLQ